MKPPPENGTRRQVPCPTCKQTTLWEGNAFRPFCSERCQLIDRGAWAEERYRVASQDSPSTEEGED